MNTVEFHIYLANDVDDKWGFKAIDAINELSSQIDCDINSHYRGGIDLDLKNNWNETLDHFEDVLRYQENEYIWRDEYHMLLINSTLSGHGAGRTEGAFGPHGGASDSPGVVGGTNVATKNSAYCYGGDDVFKHTVIHEFCHAMMHSNEVSTDSNYDEHDRGAIYKNLNNDPVSPLQLWYTAGVCSGNAPPDDGNCNNTAGDGAGGSVPTLSDCARRTINKYMASI